MIVSLVPPNIWKFLTYLFVYCYHPSVTSGAPIIQFSFRTSTLRPVTSSSPIITEVKLKGFVTKTRQMD
uniref:Secreted protein n=1 Tax=Panagrellus redivivus TaxID=6233 RepID=A0A7E4W9U2_PANRE